jgi:hypothetical protein
VLRAKCEELEALKGDPVSVALPIRFRPARSAAESQKTAPDLGQAS